MSAYARNEGNIPACRPSLTTIGIRRCRPFSRGWPTTSTMRGIATAARAWRTTRTWGVTATARQVRAPSTSVARRRPHGSPSSARHRGASPPCPVIILLVVLIRGSSSAVGPVIKLTAVPLIATLVISIPVVIITVAMSVVVLIVLLLLLLLGRRRMVLLWSARPRWVMSLRGRSLGSGSSTIRTSASAPIELTVVCHYANPPMICCCGV
ncbi:uncharacterized protein B0T15DRAFT_54854 [Chaetomium strumarium]|uniref:Uncharacterized protein n=1 Tax=Chaetomium strumarium TaxID=1170767 RepID=A0AAJ0H327_9PEZI|nr:hypothetical protein B0T15DRAFT_54854 [Chaetomium strumarium]